MTASSPAVVDPSSAWMNHLERAHALAHQAARTIAEFSEPNLYLRPAAKHLEQGVASIYDAFDGRTDRPTAINRAHGQLWEAAVAVARGGLPSALEPLRDACSELIASEKRLPLVALAGRPTTPFRASTAHPPLHVIERSSLAPSFKAPPVPEGQPAPIRPDFPQPKTFDELRATAEAMRKFAEERTKSLAASPSNLEKPAPPPPEEPPPGYAYVPPNPTHEDDFIRHWARICFEDVGLLGVQRAPLLGDDWRSSSDLERRMLASVDALAALGPVAITHVEKLAMDAPAPDPMRIFAVAMIGGCLEGRDALGGAERVLQRFGAGDPLVAEAFVSAMKLAPNPFIPGLLRSLLHSSEMAARAIAVEVLAYRRLFTREQLEVLAKEEEPSILAHVLPVLATTRHPDFLPTITRVLEHRDARVIAAALDAMALGAHREAAASARKAVGGALGKQALSRLAIVADEDDASWLLAFMKDSQAVEAIEAVGWAGLIDAVPALISVLESGEDDAKIVAGAALERLLGANLMEAIEIEPEKMDDVVVHDPTPEPEPSRQPLAEVVSDPRFLPPPGSKDKLELPSVDPEKWRAYWMAHGKRFDRKQRIRRGQPYSPSVSLYELDRLPLLPEERRRLQRELAARTGKWTFFDPHDFVVVQGDSLKAWEGLVAATEVLPGGWGRPVR